MNSTQSTQRPLGKYDRRAETARIEADWAESARWQRTSRTYSATDVVRLRGSIKRDNTIAQLGAEKLWELLQNGQLCAQSAANGGQAVQRVKAGAQAIYLSGEHTTAEQSSAETIRPDQSLYATDSLPSLVRRINNAFERADQIQWKAASDADAIDYFAPIIADAAAHHGNALNAFELMKNMIRAGAAGVRFDDQFTATRQRGQNDHVLMPTRDMVQKLDAARLAADAEDVPTLIIAHTTANTTHLLSSDCDARDQRFMTGERSEEGFHAVRGGIEQAIARGLAYAPYADVLWLETAEFDLDAAREFAQAIRRELPQQLLAYSCAADADCAAHMQRELSALGYQLQFAAPVRCELDARAEMAA